MITSTLTRRYQREYNRIQNGTEAEAIRIWNRIGGVGEPDRLRFLDNVQPVIGAGQQLTADLFSAYLSEGLGTTLVAPTVAELEGLRTLTAFEDVYSRPVVAARTALAEGQSFAAAMQAARVRLGHLASTDVALAHRGAARVVMDDQPRVRGYRRTLTGASCALCATASTQRYRKSDLMPIHSHCDCGIAPIIGDSDPGAIVNKDLLQELQRATPDGQNYWQNRDLRVTEDGRVLRRDDSELRSEVVEHGETGPTLVDASHHTASL